MNDQQSLETEGEEGGTRNFKTRPWEDWVLVCREWGEDPYAAAISVGYSSVSTANHWKNRNCVPEVAYFAALGFAAERKARRQKKVMIVGTLLDIPEAVRKHMLNGVFETYEIMELPR